MVLWEVKGILDKKFTEEGDDVVNNQNSHWILNIELGMRGVSQTVEAISREQLGLLYRIGPKYVGEFVLQW